MAVDINQQHFEKIKSLQKGIYEDCSFERCNFSGVDFSNFIFVDCKFSHCDVSLIKTHQSALRNVHFNECKMLGVNF